MLPTLLLSRTSLDQKRRVFWVELGCLCSLELNLALYVQYNVV